MTIEISCEGKRFVWDDEGVLPQTQVIGLYRDIRGDKFLEEHGVPGTPNIRVTYVRIPGIVTAARVIIYDRNVGGPSQPVYESPEYQATPRNPSVETVISGVHEEMPPINLLVTHTS